MKLQRKAKAGKHCLESYPPMKGKEDDEIRKQHTGISKVRVIVYIIGKTSSPIGAQINIQSSAEFIQCDLPMFCSFYGTKVEGLG